MLFYAGTSKATWPGLEKPDDVDFIADGVRREAGGGAYIW